jgi:hypothetical protein
VIRDTFVQGAQDIADAINKLQTGDGKTWRKRCDVASRDYQAAPDQEIFVTSEHGLLGFARPTQPVFTPNGICIAMVQSAALQGKQLTHTLLALCIDSVYTTGHRSYRERECMDAATERKGTEDGGSAGEGEGESWGTACTD